jgi:hypothetical protein
LPFVYSSCWPEHISLANTLCCAHYNMLLSPSIKGLFNSVVRKASIRARTLLRNAPIIQRNFSTTPSQYSRIRKRKPAFLATSLSKSIAKPKATITTEPPRYWQDKLLLFIGQMLLTFGMLSICSFAVCIILMSSIYK